MENTRTFVIDGRQQYYTGWLITMAFCASDVIMMLRGRLGEMLLSMPFCVIIAVWMTNLLMTRITISADGVQIKSWFKNKHYRWDMIADYGIVHKKRLGNRNSYTTYTVYFSDRVDARKQAWRYLPFDGIRMNVRRQDVEKVASEIRTFGREHTTVEPYISEYWE